MGETKEEGKDNDTIIKEKKVKVAIPKETKIEEKKEKDNNVEESTGRRSGRTRKSVNRFLASDDVEKEDFKVEIGKGTEIKSMPIVVENLQRFSGASDELQKLYRVMFNKRGKKLEIKKHILEFSGITWGSDDEEKREERIEEMFGKWKIDTIKKAMDILGVDRSKLTTKSDLVEKFIPWLLKPEYDSKMKSKLVTSKKSSKKSSKKRKAGGKKTKAPAKKKRKTTKNPKKSEDEEENDEDDDDEEEEDNDNENEEDEDDDGEDDAEEEPKTTELDSEAKEKIVAMVKKVVADSDASSLTIKDIKTKLSQEFGDSMVKKCKDLIKETAMDAMKDKED